MNKESFTIYSVPGPNHVKALMKEGIAGGWEYAIKSIEFIQILNPEVHFEVVFGHLVEFGEVPELPKLENINFHVFTTTKPDLNLKYPDQPSSQHGALLNYTLAAHELSSDYFVVLDPDCYLLMGDAFRMLRNFMEKEGLALMGVSYPTKLPKTYYWDFPTAYFQIMNSNICSPSTLNFMPDEGSFIADQRQPGGAGVSAAKSTLFLFKLPKIFRKTIFWFAHLLLNGRGNFSFLFAHLTLNLPYKGMDLFRDTGWFNRKNLGSLPSRVIPHLVPVSSVRIGFDEEAYLQENDDIRQSGVNASWHFLTNGIYENRKMGHQKLHFRLLRKYLGGGMIDSDSHPATSIVMGESIFNKIQEPIRWGNMNHAFEYHWKGKPFCLHLGHSGKSTKFEDIFKLEALKNHLLKELEANNVSSN